jgi:putative oxidoreductase
VGALVASGYLFPLLKATEVLSGALLLSGFFVPLALTLLAPVIVNIVAFHLFLAPGNYPVLAAVLACELFLAWTHRAAFASMLRARPTVRVGDAMAAHRELRHAA